MNNGNLNERTIADANNDAEAARLRARGLPYQEIARIQGIARTTAYDRVWRAIRSAPIEAGEQLRALELARLDELITRAWTILTARHPYVSNGKRFDDLDDDGPKLAAIRELRQLSESRRKLLGLDAPTQHDVKVSDGDGDIERLVAELLGGNPRSLAATHGLTANIPLAEDQNGTSAE